MSSNQRRKWLDLAIQRKVQRGKGRLQASFKLPFLGGQRLFTNGYVRRLEEARQCLVPPCPNYPQREDTRPLRQELSVNPKRDRSGRDISSSAFGSHLSG